MKEAEEKKARHIYRICYIDPIYHFWFSSLVPVHSSYHLVSLLYSNTSLVSPTFFVLLLANTLHFYVL